MSFRQPPPSGDAPEFNPDETVPTVAAVACVLTRGIESEGSPPLLFVVGKQHGPVSLGRGGAFRIDGPGVLATHGYLMFDGRGVFLCSADEANPIVADAARIPRQWTPVTVPCTLLFGRSRALLQASTPARPHITPEPDGEATNSETFRPRVTPPVDGEATNSETFRPRVTPPVDDEATNGAAVRPHITAPDDGEPTSAIARPRITAKTDDEPTGNEQVRPRVTRSRDDESTNVEPRADLSGAVVSRGLPSDEESTRMNADISRPATAPQASPPLSHPSASDASSGPPVPTPPMAQGGYPLPPPPAYPAATGSPELGRRSQAGAELSATTSPRATAPSPLTRAIYVIRAAVAPGSAKRTPVLVAGCSFVAVFVVTLVTMIRLHLSSAANVPLPPPPAPAPMPAAVAAPVTPGIVVYPAPVRVEHDAGSDGTRSPKGKTTPLPPTLERTAVDAINRGDLAGALVMYRQLAQQEPDNPAFAQMVRLLQPRVGTNAAQ